MTQYDMQNNPIAVWVAEGPGLKGGDWEWTIRQEWHPDGTQKMIEIIFKRHIMEGLGTISGNLAAAVGAFTNKIGL